MPKLPRNKMAKNKKSKVSIREFSRKQLINGGTVSKAVTMYQESKAFVENFLGQPGMVDITKTNVWQYIQWEDNPEHKGLKIVPKFKPIENNERLKKYWERFEKIFPKVRSGKISEAELDKMLGDKDHWLTYKPLSVEDSHHHYCLVAGIDYREGRFSGQTSDYRDQNKKFVEDFNKLCDIVEEMMDLKNWEAKEQKRKETMKMAFNQLLTTRKYDYFINKFTANMLKQKCKQEKLPLSTFFKNEKTWEFNKTAVSFLKKTFSGFGLTEDCEEAGSEDELEITPEADTSDISSKVEESSSSLLTSTKDGQSDEEMNDIDEDMSVSSANKCSLEEDFSELSKASEDCSRKSKSSDQIMSAQNSKTDEISNMSMDFSMDDEEEEPTPDNVKSNTVVKTAETEESSSISAFNKNVSISEMGDQESFQVSEMFSDNFMSNSFEKTAVPDKNAADTVQSSIDDLDIDLDIGLDDF